MSRVTLGAILLMAITCLSLPGKSIAQSDQGEPEASAPGGYGGEYGGAGEYGGRGGYGGEMGGEYGGRGGYGTAAAEAEDLFGAPGTKATRKGVATSNRHEPVRDTEHETSAPNHIEAALQEPLKSPLQYEDQPLNEIISMLQEEFNIPIMFDNAALEEVAISPDTEVTINLRNIKLRSALNLMLRQPGLEDLTFVIDEEVLLITTEEKANEKMTVEVYRVDDLTRGVQQSFGNEKSPYSSLVEVVTRCVAYDTWMANDSGEGEVRLMQPGMLVVANTRRVHEQVRQLLDELRAARAEIDNDSSYGRGYGGRGGRGSF